MTGAEALASLLACTDLPSAQAALAAIVAAPDLGAGWAPVGRENNLGTIGAAADPGRSLVERVTNAIDAVLERARVEANADVDCPSPGEAARRWLGVPAGGVGAMSRTERRALAERISVTVDDDAGWASCVVTVQDQGIGLTPEQMPRTILALNESNKVDRPYLCGAYGQGGSSTFAACALALIVCRSRSEPGRVGFTVVRFEELPAARWKHGRYVYLTSRGAVPEAAASDVPGLGEPGVLVRHFGYDLSRYRHAVGHGSLYVLLRHALFDPVLPFRLKVPTLAGARTIKGARAELQGATDADEAAAGLEPTLVQPRFPVALGGLGQVEVEYWVLPPPTPSLRVPIGHYVDPYRPVLLTFDGQVHGELPVGVVRTDARRGGADLPYLATRLVVHVRCDGLVAEARRALFVTNREEARSGVVRATIEAEVVRLLRSDDDLTRLNEEARRSTVGRQDEESRRELQTEVARLLRATGAGARARAGARGVLEDGEPGLPRRLPGGGRPGPGQPTGPGEAPALNDPPTRLDLLGPRPLELAPGQRRYVQVSTDAAERHDPALAVELEGDLLLCSRTPLRQGRLRLLIEADRDAAPGSSGRIGVRLEREGLPALEDSLGVLIVNAPLERPDRRPARVPEIECEPVEGPDDPAWVALDWPADVRRVASAARGDPSRLTVHYSRAFPPFRTAFDALTRKDPVLAASFETRYRVWLGVHSLILARGSAAPSSALDDAPAPPGEDWLAEADRAERCRIAQVAAIVATQEVQAAAGVAAGAESG